MAHAARCVVGRVLVGGCGVEATRPSLLENDAVICSETVEIDQEIVAVVEVAEAPVAEAPIDDVPIETGPVGEAPIEERPAERVDSVAVADVRDRVALAVESEEQWDAVLLDIDTPEVETDDGLRADLATLLPEGGRVVVVTREPSLTIDGFQKIISSRGDEYVALLFTKIRNPRAGMVRRVGRGWVRVAPEPGMEGDVNG